MAWRSSAARRYLITLCRLLLPPCHADFTWWGQYLALDKGRIPRLTCSLSGPTLESPKPQARMFARRRGKYMCRLNNRNVTQLHIRRLCSLPMYKMGHHSSNSPSNYQDGPFPWCRVLGVIFVQCTCSCRHYDAARAQCRDK